MSKNPIAGILFDKDGTLFDFQATWGKYTEQILAELAPDQGMRRRMSEALGYDLCAGRFEPGSPIVASALSEISELLATFRPDLGAVQIERMLDDSAVAISTDPGFLFPAAADLPGLLSRLRTNGYALGVATHDSEQSARAQLRMAGAIDAFDFIAGYDSGYGLKPGPGMLLAFAKATSIEPASIVMVGDSRHDLDVGRNAGAAMTIGVLTGPATREDLAGHADHILPSIEYLPELLADLVR